MMANVNSCNDKTDTSDFRMPDLIRKKRDGKEELTRQEINWFISNVEENGVCEDAQLGKLLSSDTIKIVITPDDRPGNPSGK